MAEKQGYAKGERVEVNGCILAGNWRGPLTEKWYPAEVLEDKGGDGQVWLCPDHMAPMAVFRETVRPLGAG